jgi:tetratricopeptide (TPR) repeat protein
LLAKEEIMRNMLVWSAVVMMLWVAGLAPGKCWAISQAQKLVEQGADQMEKKQFDQAIASFKKALQAEPKSAVTYNLLGMAYRLKYNQVRSQDLKNQEIAAFKKAIEIDPNYWVALINLGATYYYLGEKAKAAPLFEKALSLNPNHPRRLSSRK